MKALGMGHSDRHLQVELPSPAAHAWRAAPIRTSMKLVVDAKTDQVLGLHIFGDHAAEIVQAAAVALRMGATKKDFDRTIALHPTAAEELVTMRTKAYSKAPAG